MADKDNKGGVNLEDFINLMKELGLIPPEKEKDKDKEDKKEVDESPKSPTKKS